MTRAFKAILWKECHETLKWAVVGCILVSAVLVYGIRQFLNSAVLGYLDTYTLDRIAIFDMTAFLLPLVGLMIGLAQVLMESRGDKWGFLTHRPVPRSTLFWGKVVAGVSLYLVATGLPLIVAVTWLVMPGHVPVPFDAHLSLPAIADSLCGLAYYFAGLLIGMRDARWHGSRLAALGAPILCTALSFGFSEFRQTAALSSITILLLTTAAWGTFISGGRYETQSARGRFATGTTMVLGILVFGLGVTGIVETVFRTPLHEAPYTRYTLTRDGTIVKATYDGNSTLLDAHDLQGNPIEHAATPEWSNGKIATGVESVSIALVNWMSYPNAGYRGTGTMYTLFTHAASESLDTAWYYVPQLKLLCEYESRTARRIGWLGPDGFSPGSAPPDRRLRRFDGPLPMQRFSTQTLLPFEDAVYRVDLNRKHIEKVFTPAAGERVRGANGIQDGIFVSIQGARAQFDAIATDQRVVIQAPDGTVQQSVPHDPEARGYGQMSVLRPLEVSDLPTFLWYFPYTQSTKRPQLITRLGNGNTIADHYALPPIDTAVLPMSGATYAFVASLPVTLQALRLLEFRSANPDDVSEILHRQKTTIWLLSLLTSLLSATFTLAWGRRYAFAKKKLLLWTFLGFILGPTGIVLMWTLLEWPVLETCTACGRKRVVTHEHCEHCSKPFELPQSDGTEIFEALPQS